MKLAKNQVNTKQHPEAELLLVENYSHFHPHYHPKMHIFWKISQGTSVSVFIRLIFMKMKMKIKNRSHRYDIIDLDLDIGTIIVNTKSVLVWWCLLVLSNTSVTFEAQFMRKLSNIEAELKECVAYIKNAYSFILKVDWYHHKIKPRKFLKFYGEQFLTKWPDFRGAFRTLWNLYDENFSQK